MTLDLANPRRPPMLGRGPLSPEAKHQFPNDPGMSAKAQHLYRERVVGKDTDHLRLWLIGRLREQGGTVRAQMTRANRSSMTDYVRDDRLRTKDARELYDQLTRSHFDGTVDPSQPWGVTTAQPKQWDRTQGKYVPDPGAPGPLYGSAGGLTNVTNDHLRTMAQSGYTFDKPAVRATPSCGGGDFHHSGLCACWHGYGNMLHHDVAHHGYEERSQHCVRCDDQCDEHNAAQQGYLKHAGTPMHEAAKKAQEGLRRMSEAVERLAKPMRTYEEDEHDA